MIFDRLEDGDTFNQDMLNDDLAEESLLELDTPHLGKAIVSDDMLMDADNVLLSDAD